MADFCTCGAQLPPDALFCHKCGKPQRDIVIPETVPPPVVEERVPPVMRPPAPPPLSFRNAGAVRVALVVAVTATVVGLIIPFLNWLAAGFFAVFLYQRRTGFLFNVSAGVKMGWITGVLAFFLSAVSFSIQVLPNMRSIIEERMKSVTGQDPELMRQMTSFFQSGPGVAAAVTFSLVAMFVMITLLSMAGGALAAKMGSRH